MLLAPWLLMGAQAAWLPPRKLRGDYSRAVARLDAGEVVRAEADFRELLTRDPGCGVCQDGLSLALLRQGEGAGAERVAGGLVEAFPERARGWIVLSQVRFALQQFDAARVAGARAVELDAASVDAVAALLQVLLRQGELSEARALLGRCALSEADRTCLEIQVWAEEGRGAKARALMPVCEGASRSDLVAAARLQTGAGLDGIARVAQAVGAVSTARVAQAIDLANDHDWAGASALLDEVLADEQDNLYARMLRARCRHELGDDVRARADLERVFSGDTWIHVHAGGGMTGVLRDSEARRLDALARESAGVLVTLLVQSGELEAARGWLARARERQGDTVELAAAEVELRLAEGDGAWGALDRGLRRWPTDRHLLNLAGRMATTSPAALSSTASQALSASLSWMDRANLAIAYANARRWSECLRAADAGAAVADAQGIARLRQVAYPCAVSAGDLDRADDLLGRLGADAPVVACLNHALLLLQSARPADALLVIESLSPSSDEQRALITAIALRAHVALHDLDSALIVAQRTDADPGDVVWLASLLLQDAREPEARALLERACPGLDDPEAGQRCGDLLASLAD